MNLIARFIRNESGTTAIEYGLIAAIVSIAIIASAQATGLSVAGLFGKVSTAVGKV